MTDKVLGEVKLILPMSPNMELAAAQTASILAELMDFKPSQIDEIQLAIIEACINAFEHSKSKDEQISLTFIMGDDNLELIMGDDNLELKISDRGVGFRADSVETPYIKGANGGLTKRGWGLELIRSMMDKVDIESSRSRTTIIMIKRR